MTLSAFRALVPLLLLAMLGMRGFGAVNVESSLSPEQVNIGDEVSLTYTISNGQVDDFQLPPIDGVTVEGSSTSARITMNGLSVSQNFSHTFLLVANRAGNVIIPALELKDSSTGGIIKTRALVLHVLGVASTPSTPVPVTPGSTGPVVMPPADANNADTSQAPTPDSNGTVLVPTDPDGQPARVFDVITPQTTTAYVGESVPLRIESYIRADANAQQDSLPALTGSDFLMNNLSLRPTEEGVSAGNIEYIRDSWLTAISAPRAGDYALQATRDTYWTKSAPPTMPDDPFGPLFGRPSQLLHKDILSNKLVIHILPLPDEDRPASFTGAIGKFQVSGNATPNSVSVGDPVTIRFTVTGTGNFDYVRAPALASDPAWKTYVATSKITYQDESHTQAMKTFEQAVIPQKSGALKLPDAVFSYFDPDAKRYITVPVAMPVITVTGSIAPPPVIAQSSGSVDASASVPSVAPVTPAADGFAPNRLSFGALTPDLTPPYERTWFWIVQGALGLAIVTGLALYSLGPRRDPARGERASRHASLRREEEAMTQAAQAGDAVTFFTAARQAVQLRLAERWHVPVDSLTPLAIAHRDPALGETLAPLFAQADDVIYSGRAPAGLDLHEWDRRTREMLQPART